MGFLTFTPIYQPRPWGGRKLQTYLHRTIPSGKVGESWDIVDRPEACSVVSSGPHMGKTLVQLRTEHATWLMGPRWACERAFPVLVKWLDCAERLSLQVHPPSSIAQRLEGESKTELWYIAQADSGAALIAGLRQPITLEEFEQALDQNRLEACIHRLSVKQGDAMLVPSGRIHAIDAGNLILEIQQNSDTTYRVYDWGRLGLDGKLRELHVKESLQCIDFDDICPDLAPQAGRHDVLADCPYFRVTRLKLVPGEVVHYKGQEDVRLLGIVQGSVYIDKELYGFGTNGLIPWAESCEIVAEQPSIILITDHFAKQ